jgi:Zn-dependent peptidase ImmA (M78 family)/transcriptional regulator with XRE-family HTH domain
MATSVVNPDMIVLARESCGMTQGDLANAIHVTQGKISKYENGLLAVAEEDLASIAKILGYTTDFFYQTDQIYGLGSSSLFHRQRQGVPIVLQKQIQAQINIRRMQIERLLRGSNVDAENRFEPLDIDAFNGHVEKIARLVRVAWKLPTGPIQNLTAAVENAGGIIMCCEFGTAKIDAAHIWIPGLPPLFFMNNRLPGDRYRFTLAHEVGHAIMHRYPTGDIEAEADRFAAELLMPEQEISDQLHGMTIDRAAMLKPHWKVSMAALIRRARDVKAISERTYRSLFTRLSAIGYRMNEPIPLPLEKPTVVPQLVAVHRQAYGYSDTDLARILFRADPQFFSALSTPNISPVKPQGQILRLVD